MLWKKHTNTLEPWQQLTTSACFKAFQWRQFNQTCRAPLVSRADNMQNKSLCVDALSAFYIHFQKTTFCKSRVRVSTITDQFKWGELILAAIVGKKLLWQVRVHFSSACICPEVWILKGNTNSPVPTMPIEQSWWDYLILPVIYHQTLQMLYRGFLLHKTWVHSKYFTKHM